MTFGNFVTLSPGDYFKTYTSEVIPVGTLGIDQNGDCYRFAYAGAVALAAGRAMQAPAPIADHILQTPAVAALGARSVAVTLGATAATADQYKGGKLAIEAGTGASFGYAYAIDTHPAVALSAVFTVPLAGSGTRLGGALNGTGLPVSGDEKVQVALAATANTVSLIANRHRGIVIAPTTLTAEPVGVAVCVVPINNYGWIKTKGEWPTLTNGTVVVGQKVVTGVTTAGAVTAYVLTEGTPNTNGGQYTVGVVAHVAATTNFATIRWNVD